MGGRTENKMKYGLVLAGGGVRGAYQVGVCKALRELKIDIATVAGTSIGAVNGAFIAQGDYYLLEELWSKIELKDIISVPDNMNENILKITNIGKLVKEVRRSEGLDVTPLEDLLRKMINEKKIRKSKTDFGIVTFSLTDRMEVTLFKEDIPEGKLIEYIMASACLPVFQARVIEKKKFIDGGITNNMPVDMLLRDGIDNIIAVDVKGIGVYKNFNAAGRNIINIKSARPETGTLDFNRNGIVMSIQEGYLETMKVFGRCTGREYSIITSDYFKARGRYSEELLEGIEKAAEIFGVSKLRMYTVDELINETITAYNSFVRDGNYDDGGITDKLQLMDDDRVTAYLVRVLNAGGSDFIKEKLSILGAKYDAASAILYFKQQK